MSLSLVHFGKNSVPKRTGRWRWIGPPLTYRWLDEREFLTSSGRQTSSEVAQIRPGSSFTRFPESDRDCEAPVGSSIPLLYPQSEQYQKASLRNAPFCCTFSLYLLIVPNLFKGRSYSDKSGNSQRGGYEKNVVSDSWMPVWFSGTCCVLKSTMCNTRCKSFWIYKCDFHL